MIPRRRSQSLFLALLLLPVLPGAARAQLAECADCILGLYADSALTQTQIVPSGPSVDLWLGIRYGAGAVQELSSVEFSISGLQYYYVQVTPLDDPAAVLGTPAAPAGIDTLFGTGGMNVAWGRCLTGDRPLLRLTLVPRGGWPLGSALRVKRRYPPSNVAFTSPILTRCDDPLFTSESLRGGTLLLGPSGGPACALDVPATDFGTIGERQTAGLSFIIRNSDSGLLEGVVAEEEPDFSFDQSDHSYLLAAGQSQTFTLRFTPTRPGLQTCDVTLGPGCSTLHFTGRAPEVLPIASVYALKDSLLQKPVTIEAQAYMEAYHQLYNRQYWVEDGSGRGLYVNVYPYYNGPAFEDRSRRARVSGQLNTAGTRLEIVAVTAFDILSAGNPLLTPRWMTAAEAVSPTLEGTYVGVTGSIVRRSGGRYTVADATGRIDFYLNFGAPTIAIGSVVMAAGAATSDAVGRLIYVGNADDLVVGTNCGLHPVTLQGARGGVGDAVEVPVRFERSVVDADTLRLQLTYDSNVVSFATAACSGLTNGWAHCAGQVTAPGTVLVEAWDPVPLPANSSGEILRLTFDVVGCMPRWSPVRVTKLEADLAGMDLCGDTRVVCTSCVSDGDLDVNGQLTPGDAQCAFEIFLSGETVPPDCAVAGDCAVPRADCNCDRQVTPSDALHVFGRWLNRLTTPVDCLIQGPAGGVAPDQPAQAAYRLDVACMRSLGGGLVALPLEWRPAAGAAAFGAELRFDSGRARLDSWQPAATGATWEALAAHECAPGVVRVGGFASNLPELAPTAAVIGEAPSMAGDCAPSSGDWAPLGTLVFRADRVALEGAHVRWLEQLAGSPASSVPGRLALGAPHPNPAVRGEVVAELAIPAGARTSLHARIVDIRGRVVKELELGDAGSGFRILRWDRTDAANHPVAAGLYVLEVHDGEHAAHRKVVVLR